MDLFQEDLESCRKEQEESGTKSQQALAGQGKVGTGTGAGGVTGQKSGARRTQVCACQGKVGPGAGAGAGKRSGEDRLIRGR